MGIEYLIFCIRDVRVGFNQPWCDISEEVARRGFAYNMNKGDLTSAYPADFQLYKIGKFSPQTGKIEAFEIPEFICDGLEVFNNA